MTSLWYARTSILICVIIGGNDCLLSAGFITLVAVYSVKASSESSNLSSYIHQHSWLLFAQLTLSTAGVVFESPSSASKLVDGETHDYTDTASRLLSHCLSLVTECLQQVSTVNSKSKYCRVLVVSYTNSYFTSILLAQRACWYRDTVIVLCNPFHHCSALEVFCVLRSIYKKYGQLKLYYNGTKIFVLWCSLVLRFGRGIVLSTPICVCSVSSASYMTSVCNFSAVTVCCSVGCRIQRGGICPALSGENYGSTRCYNHSRRTIRRRGRQLYAHERRLSQIHLLYCQVLP